VRKKKQHFIDSLRIHVQGGAGGMGHPKFGGVGGRGGRVFVEAKEGLFFLAYYYINETYANQITKEKKFVT
jgi:GTPase involved in cell partitioning and DNA repair